MRWVETSLCVKCTSQKYPKNDYLCTFLLVFIVTFFKFLRVFHGGDKQGLEVFAYILQVYKRKREGIQKRIHKDTF